MPEATTTGVKIIGPDGGAEGFLESIGVRFMIHGSQAGQRFSLIEHRLSPRALAAPLHLHTAFPAASRRRRAVRSGASALGSARRA